ncbi:MAG: HAD family phosphatase [bacterium]
MQIELIIFDLGNVIFLYDHHVISEKISGMENVPLKKVHHTLFHAGFYEPFDNGTVSAEEFFQNIKHALGLKMDFKTFAPIWSDIFKENKPVTKLIEKLQKKYHVYVLSNTNSLHFEYLMKTEPFMGKIEKFILSFKVGTGKPDARIFETALGYAKTSAERAVFIDDRPDFVQGARSIGMNAIHFTDPGALSEGLEKLGII